jgi:hypothetical protein
LHHKQHYAIKISIPLSTLNSQLSIINKVYFLNPQITAIFAAAGGFGGKNGFFEGQKTAF